MRGQPYVTCNASAPFRSKEFSARRPVSRVLSPCRQDGRPFLWDASRNAPHATNPSGGAGMPLPPPRKVKAAAPIRSCSRWGLPCRPCCQGRGALLPHRFALPRGSVPLARGVCFLWHCPWGRPRRRLAGTVFPWSPDFPLPLFPGTAAVQPSGRRGTWAPPHRASTLRPPNIHKPVLALPRPCPY